MKAHLAYLKYVLRHKWFVFLYCLKWDVPWWTAVIHDLSKFTPTEWFPYVHSFYNPNGTKRNPKTDSGTLDINKTARNFASAWNSHQKSNKHHWQYWVLINDEDGTVPLEIPEDYVREMLADWEGAGRAATGASDPVGWYTRNHDKFIFHPKTRELVERLLNVKKE